MSNVLQFNAHKVNRPSQPPVYRIEVNGVEPGQRLILWQDKYQRFVLVGSQYGQVDFRMEPLGHVN